MVCNAILSNFALRVGNLRACGARGEGQFRGLWRDLEPRLNARLSQRRRGFGATTARMMVEPGSAGEAAAAAAAVNKAPQRDRGEDGGASAAVGKSPEKDRAEDGRLSAPIGKSPEKDRAEDARPSAPVVKSQQKGRAEDGKPSVPIGKSREKDQAEDGGYASGGWKSEDGKVSWGFSSFRGKRATMEDYYDVKSFNIDGQRICLFGMFDGHGGARAAEYLKNHLFENLSKHPKFLSDTKLAISETFKKTDVDFLDAESNTFRDDGSTASTAVLVGNRLYVGNVGDSRAVVSKAGKAIPLSDDHKPNRSDERQRIEKAGGVVMWAGTWRVGGVLAMSRAFGNRMLKPFVVADPEIQEREITDELELLVLASDGLWDVVPNEDAVSLARGEEEPEAAARKLTETAFSRGSADNITCIVVRFHHENDIPGNSPSESPKH